ncbi:hypothetical protein ACFSC6_20865 [Rufibacter sediminis]|uniref:Uncharacterized protein n=1 Tax=Rufibacter sediminis TaxID=2762756 RepID=A0ABR6VRL4_9BACT|nr:hypothetical protein [Rufibacter sediminis]MBC3539839.1 hypothetical protein [Rufibacter sediminis]
MENKDTILSALLVKVEGFKDPHDHPTPAEDIAKIIALPLPHVISVSRELAEEGLVAICSFPDIPLLYLTKTGVSRARRMAS